MGLYRVLSDNGWELIKKDIGKTAGVYILRCKKPNSHEFESVPRLLKEDTTGTLYIGSSKDIMWRLGGLRKAINAATTMNGYKDINSHVVGKKYKMESINKKFPPDNLWIEVIPLHSSEEALRKEAEELEKYENNYGEAPPFNEGRPKARSI
jgi:hypothetical protein